jgi:hypothetical protein
MAKALDAPSTRGRKTRRESRAAEFRQRLLTWKQTPAAFRPSLRALARELGTSHQLLRHYLFGLEEWQRKGGYRRANREAEEIRSRARAENRGLEDWEVRKLIAALWIPKQDEIMEEIRREAQGGPLNHWQFNTLKMFARYSVPGAQELVQKCLQVGLKKRKRFATIVKETPRQDGETCVAWRRSIWDECEKYGTDCPEVLTEELLEKYSQGSGRRTGRNNLPVPAEGVAKPFRYE